MIQPLLVTTIVFALPLGYFLTKQHVGKREVIGAIVILLGLVLFVYFGDPAGGNENAPNSEWLMAFAVLGVISAALFAFGRGGDLSMKAAVYGTVSGIMFGLSAPLTKPTLNSPARERRHDALACGSATPSPSRASVASSSSRCRSGTGRLAPSVATVSVANPIVGILIGVLLLDERLSRPTWHVFLAVFGLALALIGAVVISLAHAAADEGSAPATDVTEGSEGSEGSVAPA